MIKAAAERGWIDGDCRGPRARGRHQAGRRRPHPHLPGRRAGRDAQWLNRAATNAGLFDRANRVIPGGVNSPVRAFRSVGGTPYFVARGEGAYVWDVEGRRYIDYVQSYGASILGHAHPGGRGRDPAGRRPTGPPSAPRPSGEVLLAEEICGRVDGCDRCGWSQRDRGDHVGGAPGSRSDRARPGRAVRRLLPRSQRRPPRRRRKRRGHPRPAGVGRRPPGGGGRHDRRALQRRPRTRPRTWPA